jgi:putative transcriptional regulator
VFDGVRAMRLLSALLLVGGIAAAAGLSQAARVQAVPQDTVRGKLLVASPDMPDGKFSKTVIYVIEHNDQGAFGLVVNKPMGRVPLPALIHELGADAEASEAAGDIDVFWGGPVELGRAFLLHSNDFHATQTQALTDWLAMSSSVEVLRAIGSGHGPAQSLFVLGYSGWGPGQLDAEIERGDWLIAPADAAGLFDGADQQTRWDKALKASRGLDL